MQRHEIRKCLKQLLENILSFPLCLENIEDGDTFITNLAMDSFEMFEFMIAIENTFQIEIDKEDIDNFIFQPQYNVRVTDIKQITVGDTIDYIYQKINYNSKKNS